MSWTTGTPQAVEVQRTVEPFDLEVFRTQVAVLLRDHRNEKFPNLPLDAVTVKQGRKYARLFKGSSVYCFVALDTGNILKAESVKKPAKHARGNIFNEDPLACCGPYGVAYLR